LKIYTKTGDKGETALVGGERVRKNHPRLEAVGTVDELNSFLGLVQKFNSQIETIQHHLFEVGAALANKKNREGVEEEEIQFLENWIDSAEKELSPLREFVLPGGSTTAARFHLARAVCRRAERQVISLAEKEKLDSKIVIYLNRLSDLLFVLARLANKKEEVQDLVWKKRGKTFF